MDRGSVGPLSDFGENYPQVINVYVHLELKSRIGSTP